MGRKKLSRSEIALGMLRRGEITQSEAVVVGGLSRSTVWKWCLDHGVNPIRARKQRIAALAREAGKL